MNCSDAARRLLCSRPEGCYAGGHSHRLRAGRACCGHLINGDCIPNTSFPESDTIPNSPLGQNKIIRGSSACSSTLCRSWPTSMRIYGVSSVCAGPQTAMRICLWVTTRPACLARNFSNSSFGVSFSFAPARVARCRTASTSRLPTPGLGFRPCAACDGAARCVGRPSTCIRFGRYDRLIARH